MRRVIKNSYSRTKKMLQLLTVDALLIFLAFFLSVWLVVFLVEEIFVDKTFTLDDKVFLFLRQYVSDSNTTFFRYLTLLGSHYFLVPANLLLMAYSFYVIRNKWLGIKISAIAFTSLLVMFGLKMFFNRPRPEIPLLGEVPGLSFPSGHAFMSFTFFGLLIFVINKQVKNAWARIGLIILCISLILLIGISRIYLRVHYTSDVMAGLALGLIWLVMSMFILNRIEKRFKKQIVISPGLQPESEPPL